MTNDAKLGMLVGVLGVVVAAVLFAKPEPPPSAPEQPAPSKPATNAVAAGALPVAATPAAVIASEPPREGTTTLASTPVRTRKEAAAQTTSRQPEVDDEP